MTLAFPSFSYYTPRRPPTTSFENIPLSRGVDSGPSSLLRPISIRTQQRSDHAIPPTPVAIELAQTPGLVLCPEPLALPHTSFHAVGYGPRLSWPSTQGLICTRLITPVAPSIAPLPLSPTPFVS